MTILSQLLRKEHREADLYLVGDDHCVYLKRKERSNDRPYKDQKALSSMFG